MARPSTQSIVFERSTRKKCLPSIIKGIRNLTHKKFGGRGTGPAGPPGSEIPERSSVKQGCLQDSQNQKGGFFRFFFNPKRRFFQVFLEKAIIFR